MPRSALPRGSLPRSSLSSSAAPRHAVLRHVVLHRGAASCGSLLCYAAPRHASPLRASPLCAMSVIHCVALVDGSFAMFVRCAGLRCAACAMALLPRGFFLALCLHGHGGKRWGLFLFSELHCGVLHCFGAFCYASLHVFRRSFAHFARFAFLHCTVFRLVLPVVGLVLSARGRYDTSSVCWAAGVWCWHPGLPSLLFPTFCLVVTSDY